MKDKSKNNGDRYIFLRDEKENSWRYGIKTNECPPKVKDLIAFEEGMIDMVHQIRFCKVKSNFQRKLNKHLNTIKSSKKGLRQQEKP